MQFILTTVRQLLFQIPTYIVWLIGAILCVVHWRKHSAVSALTLIALVLFFLQSFVGDVLGIALPLVLRGDVSLLGTLLTIRGIVQVFVSLIAWVLILVAIFGWRETVRATVDQK